MRAAGPLPRTPLTVVGGFLGAGKTTFLNHLLASARGRTAVLVNDFGAVNVDAGLVADHDGTTLRLTNGCVCCSIADGFLDTLMRVLSEPFDQIVIEASGVGDPAAIAEIAEVEPGLVLGAVIVLADCERLPSLLADRRVGDTVRRQIEAADLAVLNKTDLVDAAGRAAARSALRAVKPDVRVVEAVSAQVPFEIIDMSPAGRPPASRFRARSSSHEDSFRRLLYRRAEPFDPSRLATALAGVPASLLRLKGRVAMAGDGDALLLQMVGARWELSRQAGGAGAGWAVELAGIGTHDLAEGAVEMLLDGALDPPSRHPARSA